MSVKVPPMSIPSEYWAMGLLQPQVFRGRRVPVARNQPRARLGHARAHAPDEGQVVDRDVDDLIVDDLLDLVKLGLALLGVELAALAMIEIVDLGHAAVGI